MPDPGKIKIDTTKAHPARVYDYSLGGKDNYPVDREAAEQVMALVPTIRHEVRANRQFLDRAVRYAADQGIRQFLDVGTGIPTMSPTHEVAQRIQPGARVVYVDNDPIVLVHARALLVDDDRTTVLQADVRDPGTILSAARAHLDFTEPIALMFVGLWYLIPDEDDPYGLIAAYRDAMPTGSMMLLSHVRDTTDMRSAQEVLAQATSPLVLRSDERIRALFDGWEPVDPGVTPLHEWRPEGGEIVVEHVLGGVGVKPGS